MNAVVLAVVVMMVLSLIRVLVIMALIVATLVGGLAAGMSLPDVVSAFESGLGNGANIALSYAMLGAFAVALSRSGLTHLLSSRIVRLVGARSTASSHMYAAMVIYGAFLITFWKTRLFLLFSGRQRKAVSSKLRNLRECSRSSGIPRNFSIARTPISRWRATWVL